jgi:signal transduction histidine kinase
MRGSRHRRSKHRRHDHDHDDDHEYDFSHETNDKLASIDESLLSEEDRAYRLAQKLADRKVALSRQVFRAALITVPLLIFIPFVGAISLIYFGVGIGRKAFRLVYEPRLREKFLQEEVQRRVHTRVSTERRHLEGEHHRSLEQLSASIAHEIRNPITAAKSLVQQMGEDPNGSDQVEYARVAVAELERVEKSISHLLRFAREEETQIGAVVMEDVLESAIETFRDRVARGGIKIVRKYDTEGQLDGDAEQLRRVVINLVGNAIDALEEAPIDQSEIRISIGENLAGTEVWVRVADNGLGIDDEVRDRIFDPFYTSRDEGTGLGLALCRKIVDNHGGTIEVETASGEGTEFVLTFPKSNRSEARQS